MPKELKEIPEIEINKLKEIMRKGYIENDEEFKIYSKFVEIKRKLREEGLCPK
uniref:Uncharacterized protein n=1 Tax=viral metagenome TaxID=1070528 RepID=A0A6H1ZKF2_9ZZZZ